MEFTIPFLNLTGDGTVCRCSSCQYLHIAPHFAVPLQVSNESGEALAQVKDRIVSAMPGKLRQKLESQGETGKLCKFPQVLFCEEQNWTTKSICETF